MDQLSTIQNLGLKETEAKIYLACLRLGVAKIAEIAQEVPIPRTSIYVHLKSLAKKGFVRRTKKGSVESFAPVEPDEILEAARQKADNFSKIVPQLSKLLDFSGKKVELEFFDTAKGLVKMYDKMLKLNEGDHLFLVESKEAVKDSIEKIGMNYLIDWQKKFLKKNIITQGIIAEDATVVVSSFPEKLQRIIQMRPGVFRKISKEKFPFSISLYLMQPNHVFLLVPQENFILNIENKEIYLSLSSMFRALFETGEKMDFNNL